MSYHPYPSVDRALGQIARHYPDPPATEMPEALRPLAESFDRLRENTRRAAEQGFGVGTYVLSTRRSSVSPEVAGRYPAEFIEQINQARRPGTVGGPA